MPRDIAHNATMSRQAGYQLTSEHIVDCTTAFVVSLSLSLSLSLVVLKLG